MAEPRHIHRTVFWRAYVPRQNYDALSGDGAAQSGGRWNAVGQPCIYAACELSTAWAEYNQGFVQQPASLSQLLLDGARLAYLTTEDDYRALGVDPAIHQTEWRAMMDAGQTPQTHTVAAGLLEQGYDGLIYPSFMSHGGNCVALWRWNGEKQPRLTVVDPEHRLPHATASWT